MKLIVNYDLLNSTKNVKDPLSPMKVIRNNKSRWAKFNLPLYTAVNYLINRNIPITIGVLGLQFGLLITSDLLIYKAYGDKYKEVSERDLKKLAQQLKELNIDTSYDLLLKSELDDKDYKIRLNEHKLPELVESKYILVPSYNYDGEIKVSHIEQEHVVGSKKYILSIGSKQRQKQLAYANV